MKKLLALVIAAAMVLALVPMTAMALPEAGLIEIDPPKKHPVGGTGFGYLPYPTVDYSYALRFTAPNDPESLAEYGDWLVDFRISINHTIDADKVRLAGSYADWGWLEIDPSGSLLNMDKIEGGVEYPVIGPFTGGGLQYSWVVSGVTEFDCAFYVDPSVFEEYPDFQVSLDLVMIERKDDGSLGEPKVIGETQHWPKPDPTSTPEVTPIPEAAPIPETGDGMGLFVFAGLALISMLGMVVLKKREQN